MSHSIYLPLALIVLNIVVFVRLKPWRQLVTFVPVLILAMVVMAEFRDRLVAWRIF